MPIGSKWGVNINLPGEVEPKQPSSIDRFFWARGVKILGYSGNSLQMAGIILSITHSLAAIVFTILSLTVKGFPHVLTIIFSLAAFICVSGTVWSYFRNKRMIQSEIRITMSGRRLLYRIGQHIGWHDHDAAYNNRGNPWHAWWQNLIGVKTASNVLTPAGAELLEAGCTEYNRISGLLKLAKDSKGRSTTLSPQIQAAGDEAMISLINQVSLLEEAPETQAAIYSQCKTQIDKLHELADRYEEMLSGPVTLADRLSSTTVMDNVLDQLRLEAQAHEELRIMDHQD